MLRKTFIFFLITLKMFLWATLNAVIHHIHVIILVCVCAFNNKKVGVVLNIQRVDIRICALAKRQIVDGIEHIGLSHTIMSDETIYIRRERKFCALYVLIVKNRYLLQYHNCDDANGKTAVYSIKPMQSYPFINEKRKKYMINFHKWKNFSNFATLNYAIIKNQK